MGGFMDTQEDNKKKRGQKKLVVEELAGMKSERRERFKKGNTNTVHIIKHYM